MIKKYTDKILLVASMLCYLVLAISFLLMPLEGKIIAANVSLYSLIAGLAFWLSIIGGIATQCILANRRKKWFSKHHIKRVKHSDKIGLISCMKNIYAVVADIFVAVGVIGLIVSVIATQATGYVCYVFVSLLVFSFSMHCILNGKIYYFVINKEKMLKALEREKANKLKEEGKE